MEEARSGAKPYKVTSGEMRVKHEELSCRTVKPENFD